jgi:hypothetical protein
MDVDAAIVKKVGEAGWQWTAILLCLWLESLPADDLLTIYQWSDDNA